MKIPDDFLQKISRLGNKTDEIVPKVLKEGAKVISRKTKSNLAGVIGKNTKVKSRSTGELMEALANPRSDWIRTETTTSKSGSGKAGRTVPPTP